MDRKASAASLLHGALTETWKHARNPQRREREKIGLEGVIGQLGRQGFVWVEITKERGVGKSWRRDEMCAWQGEDVGVEIIGGAVDVWPGEFLSYYVVDSEVH